MQANGHPLDALGDPTRQADLRAPPHGPHSVGELAAGLPVSRPAVSQHLRVLEEVGLVTHERAGTRHLYELDSAGVAVLRDWVDGFWNEALARFKAVAEETSRTGGSS